MTRELWLVIELLPSGRSLVWPEKVGFNYEMLL